MKLVLYWIQMVLIIVLPFSFKRKIPVAFIYQLSDWQIKLIATRLYNRLHVRAKLRINGCIKQRAKDDFYMSVLACRLDLYQGGDKESRVAKLVSEAQSLDAIAEVIEYVQLSRGQERLLLDRLWTLIDDSRAPYDSDYWEVFIEASAKFRALQPRREILLKRQQEMISQLATSYED
jgi:hypothetical protein